MSGTQETRNKGKERHIEIIYVFVFALMTHDFIRFPKKSANSKVEFNYAPDEKSVDRLVYYTSPEKQIQ